MDREAIRRIRLANDYEDMLTIQDQPYLSWKATNGEAPNVEEYELIIKVRTYSAPNETMDSCTVKVSLPVDYPMKAPHARMISKPIVFHPEWFVSGVYNPGSWDPHEPLVSFINRMIMTLQFDDSQINPLSPCNYAALKWYLENKDDKDIFPSDTTKLKPSSLANDIMHDYESDEPPSINLTFVNSLTGAELEAAVNISITADEIITELVETKLFDPDNPINPWILFVSGKGTIWGSETIEDSGFADGDRVLLVRPDKK